jgi:RNAse (barnase) inhibitor barstar
MNIEQFKTDLKAAQEQVKNLKSQYKVYITDKNIPLEDRWQFFESMPDELKEQERFVVNFVSLNKYIPNFNWYYEFHMEKGYAQNMDSIIERIEEAIYMYNDEPQLDNKVGKGFVKNPTAMAEFKEEILRKNLRGFIFDW